MMKFLTMQVLLWIVWLWVGPGMRVLKVFRQSLHPPELMVWINCGLNGHENFHLLSIHLARCGFDQDMKAIEGFWESFTSSRIHGLDQL